MYVCNTGMATRVFWALRIFRFAKGRTPGIHFTPAVAAPVRTRSALRNSGGSFEFFDTPFGTAGVH